AALAACRAGKQVIMTEPYEWIGGQFTSQAVPPDENRWIETHGGTRSYQTLRRAIRSYYQAHYPLNARARHDPILNPGTGWVSRLCDEPKVAHAALVQTLSPYASQGLLRILRYVEPAAADVDGDRVRNVTLRSLRGEPDATIAAPYVLDATELGDLLPLAGCEYVVGAESQADTSEMHARQGEAQPGNVQAITWCFAMGYDPAPGADHLIDPPAQYERWRDYAPQLTPPWPGKLFSWTDYMPETLEPRHNYLFSHEYDPDAGREGISYFAYRQIVGARNWDPERPPQEATIVNWAMNDYLEANLMSEDPAERERARAESRQLSLSLFYWLQTEAPNHTTGGQGYPGLILRGDATGTNDGLAQAPYIRESRRIRARFTVTEQHVGTLARTGLDYHWGKPLDERLIGQRAELFADSVGIGHYRIDLHPSTGGDNSIDVSCLPFQIPLGALIPVRLRNLLPACKNIGTTHITNGCYRLHPVEWNIGESAGALVAFCLDRGVEPAQVLETPDLLSDYQASLVAQGVRLHWHDTLPA
ncbi:MAG: FAD-dependent oxidoreductase, partial [Anaerolineae bacterium]|nr:FAD-dependent oxidoreductase [Anaerolineae bacterium]